MTHDVERVLADIDADHGDRCVEFLRHGVLLVLSAPCQLLILAGPEHGRTIPLADYRRLASTKSQEVTRIAGTKMLTLPSRRRILVTWVIRSSAKAILSAQPCRLAQS